MCRTLAERLRVKKKGLVYRTLVERLKVERNGLFYRTLVERLKVEKKWIGLRDSCGKATSLGLFFKNSIESCFSNQAINKHAFLSSKKLST